MTPLVRVAPPDFATLLRDASAPPSTTRARGRVVVPGSSLDGLRGWGVGEWGLARARGVEAVVLELAGARAACDDHAHGVGHFDQASRIAAAARAAGVALWVRTTVTRSNDRVLHELADWLVGHAASAWCVELATPTSADANADEHADDARRLPSLGIAAPYTLRAVDRAAKRGVEVFIARFPLCVLGPYARWAIEPATATSRAAAEAPCDACPSVRVCAGLDRAHRARFGSRELRPMPPPTAAASPARDAIGAFFAERAP